MYPVFCFYGMHKFLSVFILFLFSFKTGLKAQEFSKEYLDSVKEFFKDWVENQKDFDNPFIFDNTADTNNNSSLMNFEIKRIKEVFGKHPCKVMEAFIDSSKGNKTSFVDSRILTRREINSIVQKLKKSNSYKWTSDYFPNATIIERRYNPGKKRCWILSLPVFIKDGTFSVVFYFERASLEGSTELVLYKKENNHWKRFGLILEGEF